MNIVMIIALTVGLIFVLIWWLIVVTKKEPTNDKDEWNDDIEHAKKVWWGELPLYYDKLMQQENPDEELIQFVKERILQIAEKTDFEDAYNELLDKGRELLVL